MKRECKMIFQYSRKLQFFLAPILLLCVYIMSKILNYNQNYEINLELINLRLFRRSIYSQQMCNEHNFDEPNLLDAPNTKLKNLLVVRDRKLVFCSVPGIGASTWKSFMSEINGVETSGKQKTYETFADLSEGEKQLVIKSYTKFLIFRDPFERLLTTFIEKLKNPQQKIFIKIAKMIHKSQFGDEDSTSDGIEFSNFLNFIISSKYKNDHWNLINDICFPCQMKYNSVGSFSTILEDSNVFLRSIGVNISFPNENSSIDNDEIENNFKMIPKKLLKKVFEIYKKDFVMFNISAQKYFL